MLNFLAVMQLAMIASVMFQARANRAEILRNQNEITANRNAIETNRQMLQDYVALHKP